MNLEVGKILQQVSLYGSNLKLLLSLFLLLLFIIIIIFLFLENKTVVQ